jgi:hypothetical protein
VIMPTPQDCQAEGELQRPHTEIWRKNGHKMRVEVEEHGRNI